MASQIYSRYIPPKKIKPLESSPKEPKALLIAEPAPSPLIKQSASSAYSRYIPPPKPKPHNETKDSPSKRKREPEPELEKPKKAKKVKQEKKSKHVEEAPAPHIAQLADDSANGMEEKPKKRAKETQSEEKVVQEGSVGANPKHKKVMERREKSLQKAEKIAKKEAKKAAKARDEDKIEDMLFEEPEELHGLIPLPQPDPIPDLPKQSSSASLPPWLANPIRVSPTSTADFLGLGIEKEAIKVLSGKGFNAAFAVQAAVLPLLLPGKSQTNGDVVVSAATGSGKTLSYVLPMIENLSQTSVTRLRGLILMPTRELVAQAREVCEVCVPAFSTGDNRRVKIGTAVGSESFKTEQTSLMEQENRYDPEARKEQERRLNEKWESSSKESHDGDDDILFDDELVSSLPDHVIDHISKVDILICTPGRLVEHLKSTPGFTLEYVKWLVVDEADKLLDQTYQNWLDVVISRLPQKSKQRAVGTRNPVRKCILSATMTRDVGQLSGLKLHRPKFIVLEGDQFTQESTPSGAHVLPSTLVESGVKIEEESLKPLYLTELLRRENMVSNSIDGNSADSIDISSADDSSSDGEPEDTSKASLATHQMHSSATKIQYESPHGVLVFTKSNETAVRLGRLIALLEPEYGSTIGTLTSTTRSSTRKSTINSFNSGKLSVLVASDLVSRGLDLRNLAHVINYDMPTSVTNYVHRVGRTARAGKKGSAWSLFTPTEARWFWNEIGRSEAIKRMDGEKIKRVAINADVFGEEIRKTYEAALEKLGMEARARRSTKEKK
jgi:ATP-dependent RNA helicase DDX51/DBP6